MAEVTADEIWRPIPGYEGSYEVSSLGQVRSFPRPRTRGGLKAIRLDKNGYPDTNLWKENRSRTFKVHRLVAAAFLGPRPAGMEIRHLDGDPTNNRVENLTYGTRSENNHDRVRHGTDHNVIKTHCPQGHPYDEQNTRYYDGRRYCRTCDGWTGHPGFDPAWRV